MNSENRKPARRGIKDILLFGIPLGAALLFLIIYFVSTQFNVGTLAFDPFTPETPQGTSTPTRANVSSENSATPAPGNPSAPTPTIGVVIHIITPVSTPTPRPTSGTTLRPRIFIASERTNSVQVFEDEPPRFVTAIPVGVFPHNISASNDGHYIGVDDRYSDQISILDSRTLTEVVRIRVGHQPHDLSWAPDDSRIYVTQEKDPFISVIDTATWKTLTPIQLDSPTHDLTISPDGREIWATTIRYRGLLIINRITEQVIDRLAYFPHGSHDAYFTPDASEVWVTSSGFIENASQADPNVVIFDAVTHRIKTILPMGEYPFHSVKPFRDGLFLPANRKEIWFSDRGLGGVIVVSIATRQVIDSIKTGRAPFHLSYGPNGLLYVANHDDWTFTVIDPIARRVLHTIPTEPDPHGIVVVAAP